MCNLPPFVCLLSSFTARLNPDASIAYVTILPSDDAFGVISFAPDSLSRTVSEASGSTLYLTVQRTGGLLGPSTVYWQVSGQGAQDVQNTNGSVVLAVNTNSTQIAIRITEDAVCCFLYRVSCCSFFMRGSVGHVMRKLRVQVPLWPLNGVPPASWGC